MKCHLCNNENPESAGFCVHCGNNLKTEPTGNQFCTNCGTPNPAQARFCQKCGTTFGAVTEASVPATSGTVSQLAGKSRSWALIGGIAAGALASAATIGGALVYMNDKSDNNTGLPQQQSPTLAIQPSTIPETSSTLSELTTTTQASPERPPLQQNSTVTPLAPHSGQYYGASRSGGPLDYDDDEIPPPLAFNAPPDLIVAPSDSATEYVYMAAGLAGLYFIAGEWYRHHNGHWFHSDTYNGRWNRLDRSRVPRSALGVPPEFPHSVSRSYQQLPFREVGKNWRAWDQRRHWNSYSWYQDEMRPETRSRRQNSNSWSTRQGIAQPQGQYAQPASQWQNQSQQPQFVPQSAPTPANQASQQTGRHQHGQQGTGRPQGQHGQIGATGQSPQGQPSQQNVITASPQTALPGTTLPQAPTGQVGQHTGGRQHGQQGTGRPQGQHGQVGTSVQPQTAVTGTTLPQAPTGQQTGGRQQGTGRPQVQTGNQGQNQQGQVSQENQAGSKPQPGVTTPIGLGQTGQQNTATPIGFGQTPAGQAKPLAPIGFGEPAPVSQAPTHQAGKTIGQPAPSPVATPTSSPQPATHTRPKPQTLPPATPPVTKPAIAPTQQPAAPVAKPPSSTPTTTVKPVTTTTQPPPKPVPTNAKPPVPTA